MHTEKIEVHSHIPFPTLYKNFALEKNQKEKWMNLQDFKQWMDWFHLLEKETNYYNGPALNNGRIALDLWNHSHPHSLKTKSKIWERTKINYYMITYVKKMMHVQNEKKVKTVSFKKKEMYLN